MKHWIFVNKKIDDSGNIFSVGLYGSIRELSRREKLIVKRIKKLSIYDPKNQKELNDRSLYNLVQEKRYFENELFLVKECKLQRSKRKKHSPDKKTKNDL